MRILHLVHQYPPEYVGGTELYTQSLSQALAGRGHQVVIFYRGSAEGAGCESRAEGGVEVWKAWAGRASPPLRFLGIFRSAFIRQAFERVLDRTHPDLVHIQHLMGLPADLARAIRRRGIPYIITLHDYWWICPSAQLLTNYNRQVCNGPRAHLNCALCALARVGRSRLWPVIPALAALLAWRNLVLRQILMEADTLIAPTEFVQQWYVSHSVPARKIAVIPHGIEHPAILPVARQHSGGKVRFAYIGGLSWQKGVHVMVEAFSKINGEAELWIAGDESFDPNYASRLREKASPNVRFLGKLARAEVWDTLSQVDAVLVPSLWYETFSLIIHEAFAAGIPVVASRLGALAEAVQDGVSGLLVPPGDLAAWRTSLQQLVDRPNRLANLRANVHPPMTLEEHVDRLESLYTRIVDRSLQA